MPSILPSFHLNFENFTGTFAEVLNFAEALISFEAFRNWKLLNDQRRDFLPSLHISGGWNVIDLLKIACFKRTIDKFCEKSKNGTNWIFTKIHFYKAFRRNKTPWICKSNLNFMLIDYWVILLAVSYNNNGFYHLFVTSKKWRSLERSDCHLRSDEQMVGH